MQGTPVLCPKNSDGAVSGMVCLMDAFHDTQNDDGWWSVNLPQPMLKDLHTNHRQNLLLLPRLTSDKLVNAIDICYMKLYCTFSLNKEELHNHKWSKLHCDEPLSANALISALKLAFYFLYILSQTFKWWYMDSIASWCDSSVKSNAERMKVLTRSCSATCNILIPIMCPFNNDRPVRLWCPVYFLIASNVSKIFLSVCGSTFLYFLQECEWKVVCNYCKVVRDTWKQPQNIKTCLKLSVIITPRLDRFCQNKDGWDHCYYFNCELGDIPHIKYETGESWESWNWGDTKKRCIESACCGLRS